MDGIELFVRWGAARLGGSCHAWGDARSDRALGCVDCDARIARARYSYQSHTMRAVRAVAYLTNALQVRTLVAGEQLGRRATTRDVERRTLEPGGFPMLKVLSEDVRECYQRAEECARQAKAQLNPALRRDFLDLELRWLKLARSYEVSERAKTFSKSGPQGPQI
jgi:hypothetical protein